MDRRWKILLLVSVGDFMAYLDAPVVSVAFPSLQKSYPGASSATLAWVLDAYFIGFAAFLVMAGKLADRYGRRRVFMSGLWVLAGASLACAVAPSVGVLIAARTLQAAGAAFVIPAGQGLMLSEFAPDERKTAVGILAAIVGLAIAASPTIGGVVVEALSWRWIFYIGMGVVLCAAFYARVLLDRNDVVDEQAPLPDSLGVGLQMVSLSFIVLAILQRSAWGTADIRTLGSAAIGVAAFALFIRRCLNQRAPVIDIDMFRNRVFAFANLGALIFSIGFFAATLNSVFFMTDVWHYSILQTGLTFAPGALMGAIVGGLAGRLAERYGPWTISVPGCAIAGIGLLVIVMSTGSTPAFASEWVPGQLIYSTGVGLALTGLVGAALTAVPAEQFALGSGINAAMRQVGGALGVAVTIAIVSNAVGGSVLAHCHTALVVAACAMFAAAIVALALRTAQLPDSEVELSPAVSPPA
jgi:EmrB/QacA subfamily drug resistance transporter